MPELPGEQAAQRLTIVTAITARMTGQRWKMSNAKKTNRRDAEAQRKNAEEQKE